MEKKPPEEVQQNPTLETCKTEEEIKQYFSDLTFRDDKVKTSKSIFLFGLIVAINEVDNIESRSLNESASYCEKEGENF